MVSKASGYGRGVVWIPPFIRCTVRLAGNRRGGDTPSSWTSSENHVRRSVSAFLTVLLARSTTRFVAQLSRIFQLRLNACGRTGWET
jgi:hypothetical protein